MVGLFTLSDFLDGILARKLELESWGGPWHRYALTFLFTGRKRYFGEQVQLSRIADVCGGILDFLVGLSIHGQLIMTLYALNFQCSPRLQ